jgi:hypothetical protein
MRYRKIVIGLAIVPFAAGFISGCASSGGPDVVPTVHLVGTGSTASAGATSTAGSTSAAGSSSAASTAPSGPPATLSAAGVATCPPNTESAGGAKPITGTVYYDRNQNGQQDPGEAGLPGIPLYLGHGADSETPGVEKSPATCTDASGHFTLTPPDTVNGYRVEVRTGWIRTQCPGLVCATGGPGDNVAAGPEWVYSDALTGTQAHVVDVGLIPDAGAYVVNKNSQKYSAYPVDLANAHRVDLSARFSDDETVGCLTTTNGVSCTLGIQIDQTLYIANSGLTPVSGIHGVMELPFGEVHHDLALLASGSSPGVTGVSAITVKPATTAGTYTTITFTLNGTIPAGGLAAVVSHGTLVSGTVGTQIVGRAGVTSEDPADQAVDTDSAFCATPAIASSCAHVSDTHSFLDLHGDDNDSDRFNVVSVLPTK